MALITLEELEAAKTALSEVDFFSKRDASRIVYGVLVAVAPEKLMADYDVKGILDHCERNHSLSTYYNFHAKEAAIQLQLPELWEQHLALEDAQEKLLKTARFLKDPGNAESL